MIEVLLPTYNGESFLKEQINSILKQDYNGSLKIIIRDDGSVDNTNTILHDYQKKYPDQVTIINDQLGNLGPIKNIQELIIRSTAPYIFLSDQDDLWHPNKVSRLYDILRSHEGKTNNKKEIIVHCDLEVIDRTGVTISSSFFKSDRLHLNPNNLPVENFVTGNAMCFNRLVVEKFQSFPDTCLMHDWWLALQVHHNDGHIITVKEQLGKYRQHDTNVVGAASLKKNYCSTTQIVQFFKNIQLVHHQANNFQKYSYTNLIITKIYLLLKSNLKRYL